MVVTCNQQMADEIGATVSSLKLLTEKNHELFSKFLVLVRFSCKWSSPAVDLKEEIIPLRDLGS